MDMAGVLHAINVIGDVVHGAGTVQCDGGNQAVKTFLQLRIIQRVQVAHHLGDYLRHARRFHLEHATRNTVSQHFVGGTVIQWDVLVCEMLFCGTDLLQEIFFSIVCDGFVDDLMDNAHVLEPEQVHFDKAQFLDFGHDDL